MAFKVLVPRTVASEGIDYLKENGCEVDVREEMSAEELESAIKDCDAVLLRTDTLDEKMIRQADRLKIIARHGVGFDNIDIEAASAKGIYVSYTPAANINSVAEHVTGLILAISRQTIKVDKAVRRGDFEVRDTSYGTELKGKVLGIIGLGNIGKLVAKKCAFGLEMRVIAYDPYAKLPEETYISKVEDIEELMRKSDFISLHLPYNKALHHFIDQEKLGLMKPSAFLINAARGGLVDEAALAEVLRDNWIAGAALDVFEQEPVPADHPLLKLDNLIATPHIAALTQEAMTTMSLDCAKEIVRIKNQMEPFVWLNEKQMKKVD
ncbi:hydroxyacid dehydrogenase [Planococcus sp. 4-30]|uniref:hydroxyacid dehydrogenase n=1 Tax=Planococcus sp. 4-30 TaxID=2874583 RepID=UPI001CBF0F78|nr:hydroxyacid dehydrogenase [Planococcus sp. 4-30]